MIDQLKLQGNEKILDLACGYGRHSLELARRGYDVTGIDIISEYIEYATEQTEKEGLKAKFLCMDIREVNMKEGNPIRLYTISEISKIFSKLGMSVCKSYADYTGKPSSDNDVQLMIYSVRG